MGATAGHGDPPGKAKVKRHVWMVCFGVAAVLAGAAALATGTGEAESPEGEPDNAVVLGEEDLADRAEILRNMYRRITPPDMPLVQDVGTWPAAWEEFGASWEAAAADREYWAWVVPIEVSQEAGLTVVEDGNGAVLWRGWTDFARPESADVVLTGGLVAEEDWDAYEGVRDAVAAMRETAGGTPAPPVMRTTPTNGLRFTAHEWTTNGTFRLELAYEIDTNVDIFAYAVACTSSLVVATWTNDENQVVTDTNTVWTSVGLPFNGMESDWEQRGTVAISNGVAEFEDSGFSDELSRLRFYAAVVAQDTDGDGLNDGWESFVYHTDPGDEDTDGDGFDDGLELSMGAPMDNPLWTGSELAYRLTHVSCTVTTNSRSVTTNWHGLRAQVEDSLDCGGNNDSQQVDTAELEVDNMLDSGYHIGLQINGRVEDVDTNYDVVTFVADTDYYCFSSRDGIPDGQQEYCLMVATSAVLNCLILEGSTVELTYDTVGHKWHSDAFAEITYATNLGPHVSAVTGPSYVQVGKTIQMMASQAGGGPYEWTVPDDGVAGIDGNGVLTGLAPGVTVVTATDCAGCTATQAVTVVQIDFLAGGSSLPASELKIGKWENAFGMVGTNVVLTNNFIDLDPDRFILKVSDFSQVGAGSVGVLLETTGSDDSHNDGATAIDLSETPANSGIFVSTNLLLVSDNIDDNFSYYANPADDARNDRTHKIAPGGKVRVQYPETGPAWATKEISVPLEGTIHFVPIVMRSKPASEMGSPLVLLSQVEDILAVARERFGQIGINLTWEAPAARDPLPSMTTTNSFLVRDYVNSTVLSSVAKNLLSEVGTVGNTNDIHIVFVQNLKAGDRPISGNSVFGFYYDNSEQDYFFNVFLNSDYADNEEYMGYIVAHELGHLLTNAGHELQDKWRLMYVDPETRGIAGSRRFTNSEETTIGDESHVH